MDRSISQALRSLVPALSDPIPTELLELASSLLAQSRSKASSLKAEEEIARSYVCANIACERLRQSLSLPKIEPRPPCPPRIYQKLYRYLDAALRVGNAKRNPRTTRAQEHVSPPVSTPVKPRNHVSPTYTKPTRRNLLRRSAVNDEVPVWVMPVIRRLCRRLEAPKAPHHIYAGVSSIYAARSYSDNSTSRSDIIQIPSLIVVVFFLVITRLAGVATPSEQYVRQRDLALDILKELGEKDIELEDVDAADVDALMRRVGVQKWTDMDWFHNIRLGSGVATAESEANPIDDASPSDEEDEGPLLLGTRRPLRGVETSELDYLQPGLGTMMQDKVDYLSDERRRDFQEWKTDILLRIREREKEHDREIGVDIQ